MQTFHPHRGWSEEGGGVYVKAATQRSRASTRQVSATSGFLAWLRIAGVSFVAVLVVGVVFWLFARGAPWLEHSIALTLAALAAVPIVLPFIWSRITAFSILGISFSLAAQERATENVLQTEQPISLYDTGALNLIALCQQAAREGTALVAVELKDGKAWWLTRLYALCAVLDDATAVEAVVFYDQDAKGLPSFIGDAPPVAVRNAIANLPEGRALDVAFFGARSLGATPAGPPPGGDKDGWIKKIIDLFLADPQVQNLERNNPWVTGAQVRQYLGSALEREVVNAPGWRAPQGVTRDLLSRRASFVLLVREDVPPVLINRCKLATQFALSAIDR